jgi:hypothetical protein
VPGPGNIPAARTGAATWTDTNGNLWLFSGQITNFSDNPGNVNDLWEYQPSMNTLPPATTPIFSLKSGSYVSGGPLTIANGMSNAAIYYTTDGTIPTTSSSLYSGPLTVASSETVQAIATAPGYRNSSIGSAAYTFSPTPATPTFSLASGTYTSVQTVTLSDATLGASIYYTTDGTTPIPSSPVYSAPITVSSTETITALAVVSTATGYTVLDGIALPEGGYEVSATAIAKYTLNLPQAATPTFSIASGTYTTVQAVTLSDATAGATIHYTTNGTTPTATSTAYTTPISVSSSETIQAIATASGYASSAVATAVYAINLPPPDFSVAASPESFNVTAGQSGTTAISVTPLDGFNSAVSFSCSGLLSGTTCSFSPATVTPSGAAVSSTLTLAASASASNKPPNPSGYMPAEALALTLCFLRFRNLRRNSVWILCVAATLGLFCLSACGGGTSNSSATTPTPTPESGAVTVTATSGLLSHSATLVS